MVVVVHEFLQTEIQVGAGAQQCSNTPHPACVVGPTQQMGHSWHGGPDSAWLLAWSLYAAGRGSAWKGPEQHSAACILEPAPVPSVAGIAAPFLGLDVIQLAAHKI